MKYKVKQTFTGENGKTYERGEVIETRRGAAS